MSTKIWVHRRAVERCREGRRGCSPIIVKSDGGAVLAGTEVQVEGPSKLVFDGEHTPAVYLVTDAAVRITRGFREVRHEGD